MMDEIYKGLKKQISDGASAKKTAKKFGEEAVELAIAATALHHKETEKRRAHVMEEAADVMRYYLTLLAQFDITLEEVCKILEKRLEKP